MRGKDQPDGRPAVELIETPVILFSGCVVVDQSKRASQQAETCTGATSICLQPSTLIIISFTYLSSVVVSQARGIESLDS